MRYYQLSDIGKLRHQNQDSCGIWINQSGMVLALVCDGIGGGNSGDVASLTAITSLRNTFEEAKSTDIAADPYGWIRKAVNKANDAILQKAQENARFLGMGTTLVGVLVTKSESYVINVGDSRCYLLENKKMRCVTKDHTLLAGMIESGLAEAQDAYNNPQRHMLINALGIENSLRIDIDPYPNQYETLLLCSDGLHGYVEESRIEQVLCDAHKDEKEKAETLVAFANDAGGYDNVTVVLIEGNPEEAA